MSALRAKRVLRWARDCNAGFAVVAPNPSSSFQFSLRPVVALLVLATVGCWQPRSLAQPVMHTLLTNGPVSNRLNVVILSEGYTTNQLPQFLVDATNALNALLSHPPYLEYRSYFNAFAISVASNQSGSDHPSYPLYHDTYFNSSYDPISDRLITIPPNSQDTNYSHGQGKVDALLQTFMPRCHLPVLLVNDIVYGGSDGFYKTAIAAVAAGSSDILTHETGHVLANLGDEYATPYPGFPDTEEPNTTRETRPDFIKWKAWIATNTPIPTPETDPYSSVIGLFEGAHYHPTNWYRPKLDCAMRSFGLPFCQVCAETLVLAFYQRIRPTDAFTPANTNLSVSSPQPMAFSVAVLQPATHTLSIQWSANGTALAGETNLTFTLLPQSLGNGSNRVSVTVKDNTLLVRNDPTNLLSQTLSWTLDINLPQLRLDSAAWAAGGQFSFRVSGSAPQGFVIQGSTNLSLWAPLATNSLVAGQFWYTNNGAAGFPAKFFRAITQ